MKNSLFLFALTSFCAFTLFSPNTLAKDYTTWGLPEGAKARLGKGQILAEEPTYSPDSVHLALASSIGVWLIDVRTGQEVALLTGHGAVFSVAFSPDGETLASGNSDGSLQLWDVATREHQATFTGHRYPVFSVAFSPDGKTLASADGTLRLWDVATGESWDVATKATRPLSTSVVFGPDGKTLVTMYGSSFFTLWAVSTGTRKATFIGRRSDVRSVAFSPDGKTLATGMGDGKVIAIGEHQATFTGHRYPVGSVAFSPDGKTLATGSNDFTVQLWDVAIGKHKATCSPQSNSVTHVTFSPDGKTLASASLDGTVRLRDADTGKHKATLTGHPYGSYLVAAFSPDGETLTTISGNGTVRLWDMNTQKLKSLITEGPDLFDTGVKCVTFSPDGETLAIGKADEVQLWDVAAREHQATFTGHSGGVLNVAFSPDGETLATCSRQSVISNEHKTLLLWDVTAKEHQATFTGHSGGVLNVAFSPDGETLAGAVGNDILLWDADTGQRQATLWGNNASSPLAYSPDGRTLVIAGKKSLRFWDAAIGKPKAILFENGVLSVAFSPDGKTLATGDFVGAVQLRDVATGKLRSTFMEHSGAITSVTFSPDGEMIATASDDRTVQLWDVATGKLKSTFMGHSGDIRSVAFSPDGETLASGSTDDTVLLWNLVQGKKSTQKSVDKTQELIILDPDPEGVQPGPQEIKETPVSDVPPSDIDPSLILHFSFDELKGNLTIDHSQYQNHGALVGNPQLVAGKFGNALKFNGRSDWVEVPHDDTLNVNDDFTIMAWIHTPRYHGPGFSPWQGIVGKSNNPRSYNFYTKDGGYLHLSVGEHISSDSDGKVALNTWQHVVVQIDKEWQRFWINGENVGNLLINARLPGKVDTASVRIGNTHDNAPPNAPDRHFLGMIDEIRIYNRALSKAEIIQQMQIGYE
ncbi:hypothetical protein J5I95_18495 [Candidatus Poribacteria bacterium]|nr:hypothetical protein [Candidatus Poribacteria bacterium]